MATNRLKVQKKKERKKKKEKRKIPIERNSDVLFSLFSSCLSTFPSYILPFSSSSLKNDGNLKIGFDPRPATLHF